MNKLKISIIGAGHMGLALAKGFLKSKAFNKSQIILASPRKPEINLNYVQDNNIAAKESKIVFLAVKPGKVQEVLGSIETQEEEKLIVSMAAGVSLQKLERLVQSKNLEVVRIMPSLAIQTGDGVIGLYSKNKKTKLLNTLKEKLSLLGELVEVRKERDLDILTIILGCSPAIIAYFAQSYANFSLKQEKIIIKSMLGSLKYVEESGLTFSEVIEAVATPGGITENILNYWESKKVKKNLALGLKSGYTKLSKSS